MTNRVVVLLSDEEFETVKARAGLVPLSAWFRALALGKKPSKAAVHVETLRASDPMAAERPDVEYGSEALPSGGSVASLDAVGISPKSERGKVSVESWRAGRKPLDKPKDRKK